MKWLIINEYYWERGGLHSRTREVAQALLIAGHSVEFMSYGKDLFWDVCQQFPEQTECHQPTSLNNKSIRPRDVRTAARVLREIQPDVIFMCSTGTPKYLPYIQAAPRCGVNHVVVHHGTEVELPAISNPRRYLFGMIQGLGWWRKELIWSIKRSYRNVSLALFNNEQQMSNWQNEFGVPTSKCHLWYPPLNLTKFKKDIKVRDAKRRSLGVEDDYVIGCVGHLNNQKSFDVAIRGAAKAIIEIPNLKLLIAGCGPERGNLERLIEELNLEKYVSLLGERNDIPELMNAFDLFCLPSTLANETLGIVILEAMASRTPVVTTDLPGPLRLSQNGTCTITVPKGEPQALADAWIQIHQDGALRDRLVTNAMEQVALCDREKVVNDLIQLLGD